MAALFEGMRDGVLMIDATGRIVDANPAMCVLTGFSRDELGHMHAPFSFWPEGPAALKRAAAAARELMPAEEEAAFLRPRSGGIAISARVRVSRVHDGSLAPAEWVVTFTDRSEAMRVEEAVRDSEERHRSIVETAVDAIITIDETGHIESLNAAATRMFGYTPAEVIGRNVSMLMPEPDASAHDRYVGSYVETGERRIIGSGRRVTGLRKDGSTFPMHLAVGEMWVGGRRAFTGVVRDETLAAEAEAGLLRARDEQEALRRLAMTVAVEAPPEIVFSQAAEIVARLLGRAARAGRAVRGVRGARHGVVDPPRRHRRAAPRAAGGGRARPGPPHR